MIRIISAITGLFLVFCFGSYTQDADSVVTSRIEEFTVDAARTLEWKPVFSIEQRSIETNDGQSVTDLARVIPSSRIQTNSRGESSLYIRGAGERQVLFFLDGIPLNLPWDNKIDLSLIPSGIVGDISVTRGIPSVTYGANAISGIVHLSSHRTSAESGTGKLLGRFGSNNNRYVSGIYSDGSEQMSFHLSASHHATDGFSLPSEFHHPDNPSNLRMNSGQNSYNVFGRASFRHSANGTLDVTGSVINASKDVPPELDVETPRYWKYPSWQRVSLGLSGEQQFESRTASRVHYMISGASVKSRLNQFSDNTYSEISDAETSDDAVLHGRVMYAGMAGNASFVSIAISGFSTKRQEFIRSEGDLGRNYSQQVMSLGLEYEYFWNTASLVTGVGYDHSLAAAHLDETLRNSTGDYTLTTGLKYSIGSHGSFSTSIGRKTRFPTLRESFSGALGRFQPNPGLKPETAYSFDAGLSGLFDRGESSVIFFISDLHDGIVRESLPGGQFRRINKQVIRTYGTELLSRFEMGKDLSLSMQLTWLSAWAKNEGGVFADTLEYRPQIISSVYIQHTFADNVKTALEVHYNGRTYGLRGGSPVYEKLPDYFIMNLRLSYTIGVASGFQLELFGRADNLLDTLYFSQWGLPGPGRAFQGGIFLKL